MKNINILFFVIILFLSDNLLSQNIEDKKISKTFEIEIIKTDSTKDYYIIYAISDTRKFKIASRKVDSTCRNVFINEKYTTRLISMNELIPIANPCDVHHGFGWENIIRNEPEWGCDVFLSEEIYGLCYTTDIEEINKYKQWKKENLLFPQKRIDYPAQNAVKTKKSPNRKKSEP